MINNISRKSINEEKIENEKIFYRKANVNDIDALVEYRIKFLDELYDRPKEYEIKIIKKTIGKYFSKKIPTNDFIAWIAEFKGKIVGTSGMVIWRLPSRYGGLESGKLGYILNLYTIPEERSKGICTRLLNELIKEARSLGLKYLHLHASRYGINVYKKLGFTEPNHKELILKLE
jgi:GNAT superfamily N-acetyltransferase